MPERPTRHELLGLIDFLWGERHDAERNRRAGIPASETPLSGWVLDEALGEYRLSVDPREAEARLMYEEHPDATTTWNLLTEEQRNRWRARAKAPSHNPRSRPSR